MKIHFDKATDKPPHALSAVEMRQIVAAVPPEWIEDVSSVRFSNALDPANRTYLYKYTNTLTVYSRGRNQRNVISAILTELAAYNLGYKRSRWAHPSESQSHLINQIVAPLTEQIWETFPKSKPNPVYPKSMKPAIPRKEEPAKFSFYKRIIEDGLSQTQSNYLLPTLITETDGKISISVLDPSPAPKEISDVIKEWKTALLAEKQHVQSHCIGFMSRPGEISVGVFPPAAGVWIKGRINKAAGKVEWRVNE